jgi:hypothetical protein
MERDISFLVGYSNLTAVGDKFNDIEPLEQLVFGQIPYRPTNNSVTYQIKITTSSYSNKSMMYTCSGPDEDDDSDDNGEGCTHDTDQDWNNTSSDSRDSSDSGSDGNCSYSIGRL